LVALKAVSDDDRDRSVDEVLLGGEEKLSVGNVFSGADIGLQIDPEEGLSEDYGSNILVINTMDVSQLHSQHQKLVVLGDTDVLCLSAVRIVLVQLNFKRKLVLRRENGSEVLNSIIDSGSCFSRKIIGIQSALEKAD